MPSSLSVAVPARSVDRDDISRFDFLTDFGRELLAVQEVPARLAGLPALRASRTVAAVGEEGEGGRLQHPHGADDAVSSSMLAVAFALTLYFLPLVTGLPLDHESLR